MEAVDDLTVRALPDPDLVAIALLSLRRASSPVDRAPSPPAPMDLPPACPCHLRRPRSERRRRIGNGAAASCEMLSNSKDAAASRGRISDSKYASASRRRPSPMTPLEYCSGSGASQSAGEEIATKRPRNGDATAGGDGGGAAGRGSKVVVAGETEPSILRIAKPKPKRRSSTKKKLTLVELEAMHQSLLEHREFLQKKLEAQRRSKVALVAKNKEMKRQKGEVQEMLKLLEELGLVFGRSWYGGVVQEEADHKNVAHRGRMCVLGVVSVRLHSKHVLRWRKMSWDELSARSDRVHVRLEEADHKNVAHRGRMCMIGVVNTHLHSNMCFGGEGCHGTDLACLCALSLVNVRLCVGTTALQLRICPTSVLGVQTSFFGIPEQFLDV